MPEAGMTVLLWIVLVDGVAWRIKSEESFFTLQADIQPH